MLFGLVFLSKGYSQDKCPVNFGKVIPEDFIIHSPLVDSNTTAVIIADVGETKFEGNNKGWFSHIFKRQRRLKILDKKAYGLARVDISLYNNGELEEKAEDIVAVCYNLENGAVSEVKLSAKDVYEEKEDKRHTTKKFSIPGVKEGSIVEYSYIVKSDFNFNLPGWEFQSEVYPTLWSEYNVTIPSVLSYMSFFQGYDKYYINTSKDGYLRYSVQTKPENNGAYATDGKQLIVSTPAINRRWVIKDVPACKEEKYISSPINYLDKVSFQLYRTYDGENYHDVYNTWENVRYELMQRGDFGESINADNEWLDETVLATIVKPYDSKMQMAKDIYYYVQKNYTCTNQYSPFIKSGLQDVVKKKRGSVGEINLLLIALLKRKNIQANPVMLGTKDIGRNNPSFPMMDRLRYVICQAKIDGADYYLDATKPFLAFNKLPLACYNGHARVISKDTAAVYFSPDSIKESSSANIFILNTDKKEVEGRYSREMGFYESLDMRNKMAKSNLSEYETGIKASYPEEFLIGNVQVDALHEPEQPVTVKFDFKLKAFGEADIVYFNPMAGEAIRTNPFAAAQRLYPVEIPYKQDYSFTLNMEVPTGYIVDELPKPATVDLNEGEGFFQYFISSNGQNIQFRSRLVIKKTFFDSSDYQTLRDFFAYVVKKEAEQIVFKKIK